MQLAVRGVFRARWTERIHDEWVEHLLANRPDISRQKLERTRRLMDESVPDCLVTGYEGLETTLHLPDPDDHHVLAAAIMCNAGTIVTFNLKDFPEQELAPYGITVQHPDEFIEHTFGISSAAVVAAVREHRASLAHPPKTVDELLDSYLEQGLATTVSLLRPHSDFL
ncbi:MAG: PIN domain-containing protein [Bryobacteraceae bacterium]